MKDQDSLILLVAKDNLDLADYSQVVASEYEIPIICGASSLDKELKIPQFFLKDNAGEDQISGKFSRFGELTALYWAWKNTDAEYVGFVLGDTHFALSDEELVSMLVAGTDAILPSQVDLKDDVKDDYKLQFYGYDWQIMEELLRVQEPEYYETAKLLFENKMLFEKHCGIYKYECLDEYCSWLFPLLEQLDEMCSHKLDVDQEKVIFHLAGRLHYLYFLHNHWKYQIQLASLYETQKEPNRTTRILSEFDILQHCKELFKERHMEAAADFIFGLERKHLVYPDVRRIRNMMAIHRMQRQTEIETVLDHMPSVDDLINHHQNLENYIVNFIDGIGRNKDFINYIDLHHIGPEELLYILNYFETSSAQVYIQFLTLFEEYNKKEFVFPFMEAAVQKKNCRSMVEAKMREVVARYG